MPELSLPTPAPAAPVRLVGVGHVAMDWVFGLPELPTRPGKWAADSRLRAVGGMTANAMVAAARLGAATELIAPVGDDDLAAAFAAHFEQQGVGHRHLQRVPGAASSLSVVIVDHQGERLIVNHRGDALTRAPALGEGALGAAALATLDEAGLLLTDPRCPAWAELALRRMRQAGRPSVLDADVAPAEVLQALVPLADWAVFSEAGAQAYAPGPVPQVLARALAAGARVAVVTDGERGLRWQRAGQPMQQLPAFAVAPVVDTTAAGDVFHGALGVALAEGLDDAAALRFAAAAAALKCTAGPGVLGAPGRPAVQALLGAPLPLPRH
jgi:sulfofructose kinase